MPPLDEGRSSTCRPRCRAFRIGEAQQLAQDHRSRHCTVPEVDRVLGKAGRADTPTDPAPLSMLETVITLKPRDEWRSVPTWYRVGTSWTMPVLRHLTSDRISQEQLVAEMNRALALPGLSNAWTMPVKARTAMLSTGIRTPIGLKISRRGPRARSIRIGAEVAGAAATGEGARAACLPSAAAADRSSTSDGSERSSPASGWASRRAQSVVQNAIGGENVTTTDQRPRAVSGQRASPAGFRGVTSAPLAACRSAASDGQRQIPLSQLATIEHAAGPSMIRNENGLSHRLRLRRPGRPRSKQLRRRGTVGGREPW
jgi:Cu(I)/Ag(I) efflux system membrane protein CusA/SilA